MIVESTNEIENIRVIQLSEVVTSVSKMVKDANYYINSDIKDGIRQSLKQEESPTGVNILNQLIENAEIAKEKEMPICQDTGMAIFFVEIGQNIFIKNDLPENMNIQEGTLTEGINEGVRQGYQEGFLRKSVVKDPFSRINTGDNTPAVIHYDYVPGNQLKIHFAPKGFGSENMSRIYMLKPSEGIEGAKKAIIETIEAAGPNACPPMIVGVGIGGSFEKAALLAKKALLRPINEGSKIEYVNDLEDELFHKANNLGIGPQGMGGRTTVLKVQIITYPTHIAGLPVAINISCHATRHEEVIL